MHILTATHRARALRALILAAMITVAIASGALAAPRNAYAASCSGTAYAPPGGAWGPVSTSSVAVIGSPGYRQSYTWHVQGNVPTPIGAQAWGFDSAGQGHWYGLGVSSTGGSGSVPWGNVLAYPRFRAQSGFVGAFVTWTC
jgi:hypothetical protein